MTAKRLPPEKRARIVAALRSSPRAAQVARQIGGVSHSMVWKIARAEGIPLAQKGPNRLPPEKRARIVAALKANPCRSAVVRQIGGVSHFSVCEIAKKEGIPVAGRLSPRKRAQVVAALRRNPRPAQVARQIGGISQVAVWKIARAEGIPLAQTRRPRTRT
jgi:predicted regulator of Ras-like GTPase activity (Roadblock/LC7/MglB family)